MVDLALFCWVILIWSVPLCFRDGRPCAWEVDDAFMMTARRNTTWFTLRARVYNDADTVRPDGTLKGGMSGAGRTGYWRADRAGVIWHPIKGPAEVLMTCAKEWESAAGKTAGRFCAQPVPR